MTETLNIPYGTYGATIPQYQLSKDGAIYTTSVGSMGGTQPWRGRVWRIPADGSKAQLVFEVPGTCQLFVVNRALICVWIDTTQGGSYGSKIRVTHIEGYIPLPDAVSGTVVNIDENQVALLNQRISTAIADANAATSTANNALTKANSSAVTVQKLNVQVQTLQAQVEQLVKSQLKRQEVEDIVWSKIWDVNYLIRLGFLQGSSSISQVQDYLNDLTTFIKRIVKPS